MPPRRGDAPTCSVSPRTHIGSPPKDIAEALLASPRFNVVRSTARGMVWRGWKYIGVAGLCPPRSSRSVPPILLIAEKGVGVHQEGHVSRRCRRARRVGAFIGIHAARESDRCCVKPAPRRRVPVRPTERAGIHMKYRRRVVKGRAGPIVSCSAVHVHHPSSPVLCQRKVFLHKKQFVAGADQLRSFGQDFRCGRMAGPGLAVESG